MATSKTLAPTNVTIQIPAMTDAPDASVFSNCVDKEADAINALNSQIMYTDSGGTFNSLATLSTLLNNALSNSNNKRKLLRLACNGTFDCFYTGVSYFVDLKVSSTSYSSCIMQGVGFNSVVVGTLSNGTWSFHPVGELLYYERYDVVFGQCSPNTDYAQTKDVGKDGYGVLGIVDFAITGTYGTHFHISEMSVFNYTNVRVRIRANSSSSFTTDNTKVNILVLYRKLDT